MRIAVIDDEQKWLELLKEKVTHYCKDRADVVTFPSGNKFLESALPFNIVLMDIELNGKDGFEITKEFKAKNPNAIVIIVTTHLEMSRLGYCVDAFRYLDKLNIDRELEEALSSAEKIMRKTGNIVLRLKSAGEVVLPMKDIIYLETENRNVIVHIKDHRLVCLNKIMELKKDMEDYGFYLTHRSYLINMDWVDKIDKTEVIMKNREVIYLSARKRKDFIQSYIKWKIISEKG